MRAARPTETEAEAETETEPTPGLVAGAIASSALIAEAVQLGGTAVLFALAQRYLHADSPVDTVAALIQYLQDLGAQGYLVFAGAMIFLQVVPIAAAFVLTVSAGAIFGAAKGTAVVLSCSTVSASLSFLIARRFGRSALMDSARQSPQFLAIDAALANASFSTALTLITLLRLSPILPFSWANYIFGLSSMPWTAFSLGTFLGCFPAVAAYVSSGQLGAEIVVNGGETDPLLLVLGVVATIAALTVAGNISTSALRDMDVDLGE